MGENDLIRRKDAMKAAIEGTRFSFEVMESAYHAIEYVPPVDAIEVVCCRKCAHHVTQNDQEEKNWPKPLYCPILDKPVANDFYCGKGERNHERERKESIL